jgi:hypothetical protein
MMMKSLRKSRVLAPAAIALWLTIESAQAVQIEPLGKALKTLLRTAKVFRKSEGNQTLFYSKTSNGKPERVAFIEKGIYQPNCTHTWAIGIDPSSGKVTEVRPVEMSCPHAFPTRSASFLDQFKGKGPADVAKLSNQIQTVAKATGSSRLATDAVKRAITGWQKIKGQL